MTAMSGALAIGILVGLAGCGDVTATGPGGTENDVPTGPAVAASGVNGPDCTRPTGVGVDATVTPGTGGNPGMGQVQGVPPAGSDPAVPPCFDFQAQQLTPPGQLLTQTAFVIKDGVVQAPSDSRIRIVTQWFMWYEPTPGTCEAGVDAVVEVTLAGTPTCAAEVQFGAETDSPIYTYATAGGP